VPDTDADWERIGRSQPYYGVLTDDQFRTEALDPASRAAFFASGEAEIRAQLKAQRVRFGPFDPRSALDFGCGVGRLTRALGAVTGRAVGVDVAASMLDEARRDAPTDVAFTQTLPDGVFDWIVSIIVFQHIPPERGYPLLRELLARSGPGTGLTLQLSVYRDARHRRERGGRVILGDGIESIAEDQDARPMPAGSMHMFDYDLSVVMALVFEAGFSEAMLVHTDHGGFHGVYIHGRRPN